MISVVIPTLNAEATLGRCLAALVPAALEGIVRQVVIADGGSKDRTAMIADDAGADCIVCKPGRGQQILCGISKSRFEWLLILHADTVLEAGWEVEAAAFMAQVDAGRRQPGAAAFRFRLDDTGLMPRILEVFVHLRSTIAKLPYGDQALLIPRRLHNEIGGYRPLLLMEDVDIVRRLGRRRLSILKSRACTSPVRYRTDGYLKRTAYNQMCMLMYASGVPVERIAAFYHSRPALAETNDVGDEKPDEAPAPNIKPL
ncbi:MAG: TIGR04283 family arsenosugar biosynthesis glycosyltransferase [Alphaproteobacteria bacterium]|nr:TIGR04283 family arsenosugar biosynthesis glycosyltransferase [Alphaproteobacteria bacterium]